MKRFFLAATLALALGCGDGAEATISFHDDGTGSGYSVLLHGGPLAFRNVYLE